MLFFQKVIFCFLFTVHSIFIFEIEFTFLIEFHKLINFIIIFKPLHRLNPRNIIFQYFSNRHYKNISTPNIILLNLIFFEKLLKNKPILFIIPYQFKYGWNLHLIHLSSMNLWVHVIFCDCHWFNQWIRLLNLKYLWLIKITIF